MKAISLWQPWASAIALGAKQIETRHWPTNYRGKLAIHAAKRMNKNELLVIQCQGSWAGVFMPVVSPHSSTHLWDVLPFGAIVAVCELIDCRPTGSFTNAELDTNRYRAQDAGKQMYPWTERQMGNYELGRFGWVLANIKALPEPIPFVGRQGLFNVPDSILEGTQCRRKSA
jgi:hypothetical protein